MIIKTHIKRIKTVYTVEIHCTIVLPLDSFVICRRETQFLYVK